MLIFLAGDHPPNISLLWASILCFLFFIIQFFTIFVFKYKLIKEFKEACVEDQLVHVLANTLVVIPFMTWDAVKPPKLPTEPSLIHKQIQNQIRMRMGSMGSKKDIHEKREAFRKTHKVRVIFILLGKYKSFL